MLFRLIEKVSMLIKTDSIQQHVVKSAIKLMH